MFAPFPIFSDPRRALRASTSRATAVALAAGLLLTSAPAAPAQDAAADSARAALQRELEAMAVGLDDERPTDDPFAEGRTPDLVILSSAGVYGELAACG